MNCHGVGIGSPGENGGSPRTRAERIADVLVLPCDEQPPLHPHVPDQLLDAEVVHGRPDGTNQASLVNVDLVGGYGTGGGALARGDGVDGLPVLYSLSL